MMEFNTQTCTSKEESKRLIDLGLNPNTADMHHYRWSEGYWVIESCPPRGSNSNFIPAWSLHRLIYMLPNDIEWMWGYIFSDKDYIYDNIIDCIEWLIIKNYFNKEYLKKEK